MRLTFLGAISNGCMMPLLCKTASARLPFDTSCWTKAETVLYSVTAGRIVEINLRLVSSISKEDKLAMVMTTPSSSLTASAKLPHVDERVRA